MVVQIDPECNRRLRYYYDLGFGGEEKRRRTEGIYEQGARPFKEGHSAHKLKYRMLQACSMGTGAAVWRAPRWVSRFHLFFAAQGL